MIRFNTEWGRIGFGKPVFARIAAEQTFSFGDKLILTDQRGKPIKIGLTGRESLKYIEVTEDEAEDSVDLKIYVMIKFGTSIRKITKDLAESIRNESLRMTGVPVKNIIIMITGVKSKRVAKRDIEVRC